jgi:hypothetical protein
MKRLVFIFIATALSFFVKAQSDSVKLAELKFETLFYDFDTIDYEIPVSYIFKFNVSNHDLERFFFFFQF